jgi:hypothetical protein
MKQRKGDEMKEGLIVQGVDALALHVFLARIGQRKRYRYISSVVVRSIVDVSQEETFYHFSAVACEFSDGDEAGRDVDGIVSVRLGRGAVCHADDANLVRVRFVSELKACQITEKLK